MNAAISHSTYMPSVCGQGNLSSTTIISINGSECPVDLDDIIGKGEYKTLCYSKKIYLITHEMVTNILIIFTIGHFSHIILLQSCK
jgi:hypothetical protein